MRPSIAYLACPYQHEDPIIKALRLDIVTEVAALFHSKGQYVFSPLTHNHPLIQKGIAQTWDTWRHFDLELLERCDKLLVLSLPGWEISKGVEAEITHANNLNIPIEFLKYCMEKKQLLHSF